MKNIVTCVYCGHEYPDGTPTAKHKLLTDHIKVCEKHPMRAAELKIAKLNELLSVALRAICLTRDYVGEDTLPAIDGWEWYEAGKKISEYIPKDEWSNQFLMRVKNKE